jgi:hypothetical protein
MTDSTALAVDAIRTIYDFWRVDADRAQWMGDPSASGLLRQGYGFDWWPGDFKIQVRASGPHPDLDVPVYRLNVRTDFLCDVDVTTLEFKRILSGFNQGVPTFAICTYPTILPEVFGKYGSLSDFGVDLKSSIVWLSSTAYVHEGTRDWLPHVFARIAMLQPIHAQFTANAVAGFLGGRADYSTPSGRGSPTSLADFFKVEKFEVVPGGQQPSKWIGTGEFEEIAVNWHCSDSAYSEAFDGGISIETPFGDTTAIVGLVTDMPHHIFAHGLYVILKLPYLDKPEAIHALSIEMNFIEDRIWSKPGMQLVGNWCAEEWGLREEPGFGPVFNCFIPNVFYQYGLAAILVVDALERARMFREILRPGAVDLSMHEIQKRRLSQKGSR